MTATTDRREFPKGFGPAAFWGAVAAAGILVGLYAKPQFDLPPGMGSPPGRLFPRVPSPPVSVSALLYRLGVGSVVWYAVVGAMPFAMWGARYVGTERGGRKRSIAIAVTVFVALILATVGVDYTLTFEGAPQAPSIANYLTVALRQDLLPWLAMAGFVAAIELRRRALHSIVDRERLRAQVAEQRLIALTGQLHPHFLFNTLQGISTLIHRDADAADEMLTKLSDLLRDLLRHRDQVLVPLGDELRYTRTYLEIAELRFADRLAFEIDAPRELFGAAVPLFVLQPLVENALAHGIGARMQGGQISVHVRRTGNRLELVVTDDGAGITGAVRDGIGLSNTRERLRASFGDDQHLTLEPRAGGGTTVRVEIPYRVETAVVA